MNSYVIDLSDETHALLKERATRHGVNMEEEIDAVLDTWYRIAVPTGEEGTQN